MTVSLATTRVNADTGGGTQDITITGFGTPKAAIFTAVRADVDGTPDDHAAASFGVTDGTNQAVTGFFCENSLPTTDDYRHGATDEVIQLRSTSGIDGEANFDSWITDGVRINWGVTPSDDWLIVVTLIGGADVSANVGTWTQPAGDTNTVNVDCGFLPDAIISFGNGSGFATDGAAHAQMWIGAACNAASIEQACYVFASEDNTGTVNVNGFLSNSRIALSHRISSATLSRSAELTAFITSPVNGFTCTTRDTLDSFDFDSAYLALAFNGAVDCSLDVLTAPTSTGDDAVTAPGFTPQYVLAVHSRLIGVNTAYEDASAGSFAVSQFDGANEYSSSVANEDAAVTSNAQSLSDDTAVALPEDDGAANLVAAFSSFDANGWTVTYSATDGTARYYWALSIGGDPEGPLVGGKLVGAGILGGRLL